MPSSPVASAPALGTVVGGNLRLLSILGVGGYGVVFKATTTDESKTTYAVKALVHSASGRKASRQRELHSREIQIHEHLNAHPGVVTLHRVFEESGCTFIVMDYAPDGDLFTQILNESRYLGDDEMIKHVFLQIVDAVDYCHQQSIYHRDIKPENVLCFDGGATVALTDFGLATMEDFSAEFKTGSVYHMSPECQGGEYAPEGVYSPLANDVWSLAIILLNLATGRNPWKSATADDATFQAYLQDPIRFLPTVLPISDELNYILVSMLETNWRHRPRLTDVRLAIAGIDTFYSPSALFEGSLAKCRWEAGMEIGPANSQSSSAPPEKAELQSRWSDSSSSMMLATDSAFESMEEDVWDEVTEWTSRQWSWVTAVESPTESGSRQFHETPVTPALSVSSADSAAFRSMPVTPLHDATFGARANVPKDLARRPHLDSISSAFSDSSSTMDTAVESYGGVSPSSFFSARAGDSSLKVDYTVDDSMMAEEQSSWREATRDSLSDLSYSLMECDSVVPRSAPIDIPSSSRKRRPVSLPEDLDSPVSQTPRPAPRKSTFFQFTLPASRHTLPASFVSHRHVDTSSPCSSRSSWGSRGVSPSPQADPVDRGKKSTRPRLWKLFAS